MVLEKIVLLKLNGGNDIPTLPKDMQSEKLRPLQSEFREGTGDLIRGFDPVLERIILPNLIGVSAGDVNFASKARDYWADFSIKPTKEGLRLNIATEPKTVKDSEGQEMKIDFPVNPTDYMNYQIAMQSSKVAKTDEDIANLSLFEFCLVDLAAEQKQKEEDFELIDKADVTYSKLINPDSVEENEEKINWIVELLRDKKESMDVETATILEKKMLLRKFKEETPKSFIATVNDENLATKALILRLHTFGVLSKEGNDYYDGDVNLGQGKVVVAWFKNSANSGKVLALRSRLTSAIQVKRN